MNDKIRNSDDKFCHTCAYFGCVINTNGALISTCMRSGYMTPPLGVCVLWTAQVEHTTEQAKQQDTQLTLF